MNDSRRDSENDAVRKSLAADYCPGPIREARERQDEYLKERFLSQAGVIADVGCGDGYHGSIFAPGCKTYHGFEISADMAAIARERWAGDGLLNTELFLGDVTEVELPPDFYDLVWCLYFTPGNFREPLREFEFYNDAYLDQNPVFIRIFSRFFAALKPGGFMYLMVYKDVPEAEAAQIDFYEHTGQHVITLPGGRFTATEEGFWSARWSRESILSNLRACGIGENQIHFHDLNHISWLLEISK